MPKLVNLSKVERIEDLPDFRLPKWLKPGMIRDLMRGEDSDDSDSDDMVHVDIKKTQDDNNTSV